MFTAKIKSKGGGKMSKKYFLYPLLVILLAATFFSGCDDIGTGNLRGKIFDRETGTTINRSVIVVIDGSPITVTNGEYFFSNLAAGNVNLQVKATGYNDATVTAKVLGGKTTSKDVYLQKKSMVPGGLAGRILDRDTSRVITTTANVALLGDRNYNQRVSDGNFLFTGIEPGSYKLYVELAGYRPGYVDVEVEEGAMGDQDIYMIRLG